MMAVTPKIADSDVMANVKPLEIFLLEKESS
jgi:hypothetical protein